MTRISIELVPRSQDVLLSEAKTIQTLCPDICTINIPDLLQFSLRSYDACSKVSAFFSSCIPHIRAIDINPLAPLPGHDRPELKEVLVIKGDPPKNMQRRIYSHTSEAIIRRYKKELPHLKVYAAFDPYRRSPKEEMAAIQRKEDAGADGFFTQPFFDTHYLKTCMDWMEGKNVFWGICPVIGENSQAYWENTNNVIFPSGFLPTMEANISLGQAIMNTLTAHNANTYIMPVRVKLETYLSKLLAV
ncbi:methylenetetrahydrofolate reductase [Entomobacter blattae]|uniref:methylenetetrahydrofolate reductase n=1 Tax=Entomobacter blattae TaxID=2762277 RepID=UPI001EF1056D|nr:methylenetetrahydrofolate reductase [Entomobacter blattae]